MTRLAGSLMALCIILSAASTSASAEEVRVLSGEHDEFSRIVLIFPKSVSWTKTVTERGFDIGFDRRDLRLDLSGVFAKIPRDRIADVSFDPAASTLSVTSNCDCDLEVFGVRPGVVAMDMKAVQSIADPSPPEPDPAVRALTQSLGDGLAEGARSAALRSAFPLLPKPEETPSMDAFRRALQAQLDSAANAGLVGRDPARQSDPITHATRENEADSTPRMPAQGRRNHPQVRVTDAYTPERGERPDILGRTLADCGPFDMDAMPLGPVEDPLRSLVLARAGIVDATGAIDADGIGNLFATQISLNQPQEARQLFLEWPQMFPDVEAAAAMVDVLEGAPSAYLADRIGCGPAWMFFGFLGSDTLPTLSRRDLTVLDVYFRGLSGHLQLALKDRFAARLKEVGGTVIAASVERQAVLTAYAMGEEEGTASEPPASGLAQAAGAGLARTGSNREQIPASLIDTLERQLRGRGQVDASLIELALAMSTETRGMPDSVILSALSAIAMLRNGQVDSAFDQLARAALDQTAAQARATRVRLASEVLAMADDALFLSVVFTRRPWDWLSETSQPVQEGLRARALGLGLSSEVLSGLGLSGPDVPFIPLASAENPVEGSPPNSGGEALSTLQANPFKTGAMVVSAAPTQAPAPIRRGADNRVAYDVPISVGLETSQNLLKASEDSRRRINQLLGRPAN